MTEMLLRSFTDALETGDREALRAVFTPDVTLRASLPRRDVERGGDADAADLMLSWFDGHTGVRCLTRSSGTVGDTWHVAYRFVVYTGDDQFTVEQQAYCTLTDGRIASIRLLCSGFRPTGTHLNALGEGCATLTPRIATAMRSLRPGQVLSVLADDAAAPDGIAAWSRMTGHELIEVTTEPDGTRFQLRHK